MDKKPILTISVGDKLSTKDGTLGVKKIFITPCPENNPEYLESTLKIELHEALEPFVHIISHKGTIIKFSRINSIVKEERRNNG